MPKSSASCVRWAWTYATADGWQVTAPSRRFDIAIEEDLIEELARIHGYEQIPTTLPGGASRVAMPSETQLDALSVRRQLIARDLQETVNFAFVDDALLAQWQLRDAPVPLANPLSAELAVMRPSLLPGLVATLGRMPLASSAACACSSWVGCSPSRPEMRRLAKASRHRWKPRAWRCGLR